MRYVFIFFYLLLQKPTTEIQGYDAVAYFTQNKAIRGYDSIYSEVNGKRWLFFSEENRRKFMLSPEKFIPQFDGYCAYAAGNNYLYEANPQAFTIVDGKLYFNYSMEVKTMWMANRDSLILAGHKNWIELSKQKN